MDLHPRSRRLAFLLGLSLACALVGAPFCGDEAEVPEKKVVNPDAYQGFFGHYLFGGRPVAFWKEQLDRYGPGGAEADDARYQLVRRRAEAAGLVVEGGGAGGHEVKISSAALERVIARVDEEKSAPSGGGT